MIIQGHLLFQYIQDKKKKTIQEQDVPSLKALSPLSLSIVVSFPLQSEIA